MTSYAQDIALEVPTGLPEEISDVMYNFYTILQQMQEDLSVPLVPVDLSGLYTKVESDALFAVIGHTHDYTAVFAAINHNHDSVYAAKNHDHDLVYSILSHNHDARYGQLATANTWTGGQTFNAANQYTSIVGVNVGVGVFNLDYRDSNGGNNGLHLWSKATGNAQGFYDNAQIYLYQTNAYKKVYHEGDFTVAETATASTVMKRNASGYAFATIFNDAWTVENPTIGSILVKNTSDGYHRSISQTNFKTQLFIPSTNVTNVWTAEQTITRPTATVLALKSTTASGFTEMSIANSINNRLIIGSIGSTYTSPDWAGSTYIYNTDSRNFWIKSTSELSLFSGGTAIANKTLTLTAAGDVLVPRGSLSVSEGIGRLTGAGTASIIHLMYPGGGQSGTQTGAVTGAIRIDLPTAAYLQSDMLSFTVRVYNYIDDTTVEFHISGYAYGTGLWTRTSVTAIGGNKNYTIRFGDLGNRHCVYIGETNEGWTYPQIVVKDFQAGYLSDNFDRWANGWAVSNQTTFATIRITKTAYRPITSNLSFLSSNIDNAASLGFTDASRYWLKTATNWGLYWNTVTNSLEMHAAGLNNFNFDLDDRELTIGHVNGGIGGSLILRGATAGTAGKLHVTNGNLHIDASLGANATYLNFYDGTGGVHFGNGASNSNANVNAAGKFSGLGAYFSDTHSVTAVTMEGGLQAKYLTRADHGSGHLVGSYNNLAANGLKANPIYVIGSAYNPSLDGSAIGGMYGVGYATSFADPGNSHPNGWGLYVAAAGNIRVKLDADNGIIWCSGSMRVGTATVLTTAAGKAVNSALADVATQANTVNILTSASTGLFEMLWRSGNNVYSTNHANGPRYRPSDGYTYIRHGVLGNYLNIQTDGKIVANNTGQRRAGNYGLYDSTKTGHIWSMGTAYVISATGVNFGNLYGLAYKHVNNASGGTMGAGHQMVWCQNGVANCAMGTNLWTSGSLTAATGIFSGNVQMLSWNCTSDGNLKDIKGDISPYWAAKILGKIKAKRYDFKDKSAINQYGFIAQDFQKAGCPDVVVQNEKGLGLDYRAVAVIQHAAREHDLKRIAVLEAKVDKLIKELC